MSQPILQPPLPQFEVRLNPPDIGAWRDGNTGIPGFTTQSAASPGPHVGLLALTHGNEFSGAIVLDRLLRQRFVPLRGRLTIGFVNLDAFDRFDPQHPTLSRFIDEDINRVWDPSVLDGPRRSAELERARQIRPTIETFDVLLDLHSMLWPSDPLTLCGETENGRLLAAAIGTPRIVVADHGHATGRRIIDYPRFTDPGTTSTANLVEAGQHWESETVEIAQASVTGLLRHTGMLAPGPGRKPVEAPRFATVTEVVTACTANFVFLQPYRGGEVIAARNTLIALDGTNEIRTPYDNCLLVMPSLRPSRGHMAVRLARFR
jgi:predicted deacylase